VVKKLVVLAVLLLVVVSACGVKPTPVVPAGPAPTLRNPPSSGNSADVILYFVIDGQVAPVARPTGERTGVETALAMLLNGPTSAEAADGYGTTLPARTGPISQSPGPPTTITLPFPLEPLGTVSVNQLVCTAFAALAAQRTAFGEGTITLIGTDLQLPYRTCQA
jgi:hypothetical protein